MPFGNGSSTRAVNIVANSLGKARFFVPVAEPEYRIGMVVTVAGCANPSYNHTARITATSGGTYFETDRAYVGTEYPAAATAVYSYIHQYNETAKSFTAVAAVTGGIRISCTAHGYSVGDFVFVDGVDNAYDGCWFVSAVSTNTFDITGQEGITNVALAFSVTTTGTVARGDKSLAGLIGLAGVYTLSSGTGVYLRAYYYIDLLGQNIIISGALAHDPDLEELVFSNICGPREIHITTTGYYYYGRSIRDSVTGRRRLSVGRGLAFTRTPASTWNGAQDGVFLIGNPLTNPTGGFFVGKGGVIVISGVMEFLGGTGMSLKRALDGTTIVLAGVADTLLQGLQVVAYIDATFDAKVDGFAPSVYTAPATLFRAKLLNAGISWAFVAGSPIRLLTDLDGTSNIGNFDVYTDSNSGIVQIELDNPRLGSGHRQSCLGTVATYPARTNTLARCYRQVNFIAQNAAGTGLVGSKLYSVDTNNGNRKASGAYNYLADMVYDIPTTTSDGTVVRILTAVTYRYDSSIGIGAYDTGNLRVDRRSKVDVQYTTSPTDPFDFLVLQYGYIAARIVNVAMTDGTVGILRFRPTILADPGCVEVDKTVVASYIEFSETATTVTVSAASTSSRLYDRRKYMEYTNPAWVWSAGTVCSSATGAEYAFGDTYTITLQAELSGIPVYGGTWVLATGWGLDLTLTSCKLVFPVAGTYELRDVALRGTITLVNTSGGAVVVRLLPDVSYTNLGPSITVEASVACFITLPNLLPGSRVRIYDMLNAVELDNSIVGDYGYSFGLDYTAEFAYEATVTYVDSNVAALPIRIYGTVTSGGSSIPIFQELDVVYTNNLVDGFDVPEYSADFPNIEVEINDPDGRSPVQRLYNWYCAQCHSEEGIRHWVGAITALDYLNYRVNVDRVDLKLNNVGMPFILYGGKLIRSDGSTVIGAGSIQIDWPDMLYLPSGGASSPLTLADFTLGIAPLAKTTELATAETNIITEVQDDKLTETAFQAAHDAEMLAIAGISAGSGVTLAELQAELVPIATTAQLNSAVDPLPTNAELATALAPLATASALANVSTLVQDVPTNAELATALSPLATSAQLTTATSGLATAANLATLSTAVADIPTNSELATALDPIATSSELELAKDAIILAVEDDKLTATAFGTAHAEVLAAIEDIATGTCVTLAELQTELAPIATSAELTSAVAGLATSTALSALAADVGNLPTNAELATALSPLATASALATLSGAVADLPTNAELATALDPIATAAELTSAVAPLATEIAVAAVQADIDGIEVTLAEIAARECLTEDGFIGLTLALKD